MTTFERSFRAAVEARILAEREERLAAASIRECRDESPGAVRQRTGKPFRVEPEVLAEMQRLRAEGHSTRYIGELTGYAQQSVSRALRRARRAQEVA